MDFHVYISGRASATTRYIFDDARTFAYHGGGFSEVEIGARREGNQLFIKVEKIRDGAGTGAFSFTTENTIRAVTINGVKARQIPAQGVMLGRGKNKTWSI